MPERIRQTRWKTSDGKFHDRREDAVVHEKTLVLARNIYDAVSRVNPVDDQPAQDWCEDVARLIINSKVHESGLIIALAPTKEPPK